MKTRIETSCFRLVSEKPMEDKLEPLLKIGSLFVLSSVNGGNLV